MPSREKPLAERLQSMAATIVALAAVVAAIGGLDQAVAKLMGRDSLLFKTAGVGVSATPDQAPPSESEAPGATAANRPGQAPPTGAGAAPPIPQVEMSPLVYNTSYSGDDYAERVVASAADCAELCRTQEPCRSMTYAVSSKTCWLKRSVPPSQTGPDFVSASKVEVTAGG